MIVILLFVSRKIFQNFKENVYKLYIQDISIFLMLFSFVLYILTVYIKIDISDFFNWIQILTLTISVLSVAIFEEFLFRFLIFIILIKILENARFGVLFSLILSNIIFAMFHIFNIQDNFISLHTMNYLFIVFNLGLLLSMIAIHNENFTISIMVHFLINFTSDDIMMIDGNSSYTIDFVPFLSLILLFSCSAYYFLNKDKIIFFCSNKLNILK